MNNYQKAIAMMTVAGLMLGASPSLANHVAAAPAKTNAASKTAALSGISDNLIKTAQAKLKEVTGKTYTFSKAKKWTEDKNIVWYLEIKEVRNGQVSISNGKVSYITLDQKWADLKDTYKQQIKSALKLVDSKSTELPKTVTLSIGYSSDYVNPGKLELFAHVGDHYLTLLNGKAERIMSPLTLKEVPATVLQAANQAAEGLDGVKKGNLLKASVVLDGVGEKTYELQFASEDPKSPIFINLKGASNEITKVEISSLQDSVSNYSKGYSKLIGYTAEQLLEYALPQALQFLNIDLKGYKAVKDEKHPGVALFTKTGSPTIEGMYNTKGQFYSLKLVE